MARILGIGSQCNSKQSLDFRSNKERHFPTHFMPKSGIGAFAETSAMFGTH